MNSKKKLSGEFGFMGSDSPGGQGEFISILPPDEEQENKDDKIPSELPILPLRNTVLFPNTVIPITINREKSVIFNIGTLFSPQNALKPILGPCAPTD